MLLLFIICSRHFMALNPRKREETLAAAKATVERYDTEETALTFHHLPYNTNEKMEFNLTTDISSFEVSCI